MDSWKYCQLSERRTNSNSSSVREAANLNQSSSMLHRLSNAQAWQHDGDNTTSLHAKLHQEADKIRKWKIQTELDLREKDRKLSEASTQNETLKKSLLELQLENEKTSSKLQEEIDNRQEVIIKMTTTEKMYNALKNQTTKLEETLLRCETEKMELKYMGKDHMQHFEELATKFEDLQITSVNSHDKFVQRVERERENHEEEKKELANKLAAKDTEMLKKEEELKDIKAANENLQNSLQNKKDQVETLSQIKETLEEKITTLSSKLVSVEEELKETSLRVVIVQDEKLEWEKKVKNLESEINIHKEIKEKAAFDVAELKTKHEVDCEMATKEKDTLQKSLEDKTQRLNDCDSQLKDTVLRLENLRSSNDMLMLEKTDIEIKLDVSKFEMESLKRDREENKNKIHQLHGEIDILMKQMDREHLCSLKYQEEIKNLETNITVIELEKDDKMKIIDDLEKEIKTQQEQIKTLETALSCEKDKVSSLQGDILSLKENMSDTRIEQDRVQNSVKQLDKEILLKDSQICTERKKNAKLEKKIETLHATNKNLQKELDEIHRDLDEARFLYESEKKKSDDVSHQMRDQNQKNKEQMKHMKSELANENKIFAEKDKRIASLEAEKERLKLSKDDLEKEVEIKIGQCNRDKEASTFALRKAEEMQNVIQHEKEQSKALMATELAEMMATLDGYKENSEKMLAQKDADLEMLRNTLKSLKSMALVDKKENEEEKKKFISALEVHTKEKEDVSIQLAEMTMKNQELVSRIKDMEYKLSSSAKDHSKSSISSSEDSKVQPTLPSTPIGHVTPQKQQIVLSPFTPARPSSFSTPTQYILKTPQRSILRTCNSIPKRRKVAFSENNYAMGSSSEESDLMELDVNVVESNESLQSKCQTPVRNKSPFCSEVYNFGKSPLKTPPQSVNKKIDENSLLKVPQSHQTPNLRKATVRKTSKFFTTSPKAKAASKAKLKNQSKINSSDQSWFDNTSVYDFEPDE